MALLASCGQSAPPTRAERITAALLQIEDVPVGWLQTSDVTISAKPACDGDAYWRTFRPENEAGRFHRLQQVFLDCSDSAGGQRAFWEMTRPMVRTLHPPQNFATQYPAHADDFAAFCEFNVIGTTDCRTVVRYKNGVSVIWSVHLTSMDEWPSEQDLLEWCNARNDLMLSKLATQ